MIYIFLLLVIVPILELSVLIKVGTKIGVINTVLLVILTGLIGSYLARIQGFRVLNRIQESLNRGIMPSSELLDGALILIGGVLLLTPGFITDVFGLVLLIPGTRSLLKILLREMLKSRIKSDKAARWTSIDRKDYKHYDDIDVN